jgi:DnaJ-class molecular chaperone
MGDWYLCAEHHDQLVRETIAMADSDACFVCNGAGEFRPVYEEETYIFCQACGGTGKRRE